MKKTILATALFSIALMSCKDSKNGEMSSVNLQDKADSISYFIGFNQSKNLKKDFQENDKNLLKGYFKDEAYLQGVKDALASKEALISDQLGKGIINEVQMVKRTELDAINKEKTKDFFVGTEVENYQTTPSGLKYVHIKEGEGAQPNEGSTVKVHYHGMFTNGQSFDSSVDRGETIEFPLSQVIKGWTEGLQLMKVGGKTKFYIPYDLAYGEQGSGPIGPKEDLVFIVELYEVK